MQQRKHQNSKSFKITNIRHASSCSVSESRGHDKALDGVISCQCRVQSLNVRKARGRKHDTYHVYENCTESMELKMKKQKARILRVSCSLKIKQANTYKPSQ